MKLRIQNLNPIKVQSKKVTKGKLSQKAQLRERGIPTWKMMLLAAKGI